jgi:hypothetical protein
VRGVVAKSRVIFYGIRDDVDSSRFNVNYTAHLARNEADDAVGRIPLRVSRIIIAKVGSVHRWTACSVAKCGRAKPWFTIDHVVIARIVYDDSIQPFVIVHVVE